MNKDQKEKSPLFFLDENMRIDSLNYNHNFYSFLRGTKDNEIINAINIIDFPIYFFTCDTEFFGKLKNPHKACIVKSESLTTKNLKKYMPIIKDAVVQTGFFKKYETAHSQHEINIKSTSSGNAVSFFTIITTS